MEDKSELELIACGKRGDQEAFAELFRRHYSSSLNLARRILHNSDESQDAVQAAYLLAFRHLDRFRGDASFKTWVTRIVVNSCLMQLRDASRRVTWVHLDDPSRGKDGGLLYSQLASGAPTPEKSTWCREIVSAFARAIGSLPRPLREAYALHAISGLSLGEIASTLGLTVAAAKTRLFRARAGMRLSLRPVHSDARVNRAPARSRISAAANFSS